jgi:hypothetical protein
MTNNNKMASSPRNNNNQTRCILLLFLLAIFIISSLLMQLNNNDEIINQQVATTTSSSSTTGILKKVMDANKKNNKYDEDNEYDDNDDNHINKKSDLLLHTARNKQTKVTNDDINDDDIIQDKSLPSKSIPQQNIKHDDEDLSSFPSSQINNPDDSPPFINAPIVPRDKDFSTHYCINGESRIDIWEIEGIHISSDWGKALCVFRNIVWHAADPSSSSSTGRGTFTYHQNPQHPVPWDFPWGSNLAQLVPDMKELSNSHFFRNITMSNKPIPKSWKRVADPYNDQQAFIIAKQDCKRESGHSLGDNVWVAANTMFETRMTSMDNIIIWGVDCIYDPKQPWVYKFWETIAHKRNIMYLHDLKSDDNNNNPIVLPLVVTGNGRRYLRESFAGGIFSTWARDRAYRFMNIERSTAAMYARRVGRPRVLLMEKSSAGHRILNLNEIATHLREKFPRVQIDVVTPKGLSCRDEIQTAAETTILITPSGSTGFLAPYMRDGSSAIFANLCWPGNKNIKNPAAIQSSKVEVQGKHLYCTRLENHIWTRFPHFFKFYVGPNSRSVLELKYDLASPIANKNIGWTSHFRRFSYNISVSRMEVYVNEALLAAGLEEYAHKDQIGFALPELVLADNNIEYTGR